MPESPEEFHARISAAVGANGRLPTPPISDWGTFPWDVIEGAIVPATLQPPADEGPREGEGDRPCPVCRPEQSGVIWENERWRVKHFAEPSGLPLVLILEPHEHLDYGELDDNQAAELGRISVWLNRIMEGLPHIARTHVMRIGDGCSHLHVWFMARPSGIPQTRGSFAVDWDDILPPVPQEIWLADMATVGASSPTTTDGHSSRDRE